MLTADAMRAVMYRYNLDKDVVRAALAQLWSEGFTQKQIARALGYKTPAQVCVAISGFVNDYADQRKIDLNDGMIVREVGGSCKWLVQDALNRFEATRYHKPRCRLRFHA